MAQTTKRIGPRFPLFEAVTSRCMQAGLGMLARYCRLYQLRDRYSQQQLSAVRDKLERGETIHVLGLGCGGHNTGAGLVSASLQDGIHIISNHEEERFRGLKHFKRFPIKSLDAAGDDLRDRGLNFDDLDAIVATWDYTALSARMAGYIAGELPGSLTLLRGAASPSFSLIDVAHAYRGPLLLGKYLQRPPGRAQPIINLPHHDNHAYLAYGVSPFAENGRTTLVAVIDGLGDVSPISLYQWSDGRLSRFYSADNLHDSIGQMYLYISSSQGGWPPLSSEGRYMGAAAWGNTNRLTNPFYRQLCELFHFGPDGQLAVNRNLANWDRGGSLRPYRKPLTRILGAPILPDQMWHPDHVLNVDDIQHAPVTEERVDKAAATQMVFEDALFHVLDHGIRTTGASQLVFAGGAALNCVANMRILEHFDSDWYRRYLGQSNTRLHLWVPPIPGDAGVPVGAAWNFSCLAGAQPVKGGTRLVHAFYCGRAATDDEIMQAIEDDAEIDVLSFPSSDETPDLALADLMAFIVSRDGVIGIYQGAAETGPRALGHRSILANPTNPLTLETLNTRVKFREKIRPLAPMATLPEAQRLFHLAEGAADDDYNAYNYMVLTAPARKLAHNLIPAVIHRDGTARVQIVRPDVDPLMHAYLEAMGRCTGVEVSVNTSLNVGSPIVQTPAQAMETLKRAKGLHGIFMFGPSGNCQIAWHNVDSGQKDGGRQLLQWIDDWQTFAAGGDSRRAAA